MSKMFEIYDAHSLMANCKHKTNHTSKLNKEFSCYCRFNNKFFIVNRCNKDSAVINIPSHTETGANRNLQVTTKPEVLQASLGPTNLQVYTEPIENISTEAL
jgi:hypothetical protein